MRLLLDNCVDRRLSRMLTGHEVVHARELGWADLQNGRLLAATEAAGFEALITVDRGIRFQQNLTKRSILLVTLAPLLIELQHLEPLVPELLSQLESWNGIDRSIVIGP